MSRKSSFYINDITWHEVNRPHYCLHDYGYLVRNPFYNGLGYQDTKRDVW